MTLIDCFFSTGCPNKFLIDILEEISPNHKIRFREILFTFWLIGENLPTRQFDEFFDEKFKARILRI